MSNSENKKFRKPADQLENLVAYDPRYLKAEVYLSANENPYPLPEDVQQAIVDAVQDVALNRYPDPLANELRWQLAQLHDVKKSNILVGNGGDELLFNLTLGWGGPARRCLILPPTFSVYENNARLTNTEIVTVPRKSDFSIDEQAVLDRLRTGDIDLCIITSPNNPTGQSATEEFLLQVLQTSDALVVIDEAYGEFSGFSMVPHLEQFDNLVILRTFSKAYGLAGVRLGYVLADPYVIHELVKVRQPYSVDMVSQVIAQVVLGYHTVFEKQVEEIIDQREQLIGELESMDAITPYPSDANYILFKVDGQADLVWDSLFEQGVLVRDLSRTQGLEGCLRVTVGTPKENTRFIGALKEALVRRGLA